MGGNTLNRVSNGDGAQDTDINQFHTALSGDIEPRNTSGVPTASAGSVGTSIRPFSAIYADKVFQNGQEVNTGDGGGGVIVPGSITAGTTIQNGVVSGLAPAGAPGAAGWLHQAGSSGVKITASTSDPLVVKLDGVTYSRTSNITGGTLPSDFTQSITPAVRQSGLSTNGTGGTAAGERTPWNADRAKYRYATGGEFQFDTQTTETLPDSLGNNLIIRSTGGVTGTSYTYCQRVSNSGSSFGNRNIAKLKMGGVFNTSPTAQVYPEWQMPWHTSHAVIRCGALFVDPLTSSWNLTISSRIVGSVNSTLPATTGYATGDAVYRESDNRWYRFSGSAWARTSFVFLGFLAINSGAVEAVLPARTEDSLSAMFSKKFAVLGSAMSREGVVTGDSVRFGGGNVAVEEKGFAELGGQSFDQLGVSAVVDTSDANAGTLAANEMFSVYLDVDADTYHFEALPPVYQVYRRRLLLVHPNLQRLFVGTFCTDGSSGLIAEQRVSSGSQTELNESSDDTWRVWNPCLFGRCALVDLGQNHARRMEIEIRGRGTRNSDAEMWYRRHGDRNFFNHGHLRGKDQWADLFYKWLTPHVIDEIYLDTDESTPMRFAFSQWDEASLLYATGLSEAASDGATAGAGGASGSIASVDAQQLAGGAVGADAMSPKSVSPGNLNSENDPTSGPISVSVDPDNANNFRFSFGGGGAGTPDDGSVTYPKFSPTVIGNEEDLLNPDDNDPKIFNGRVLHDVLEDMRSESDIFWSDWSMGASVSPSSPQDGDGIIISTSLYGIYRSSSSYNAKTGTIDAGRFVLATKDVLANSLPPITSGTLRGALLFVDAGGTRWAYPITNPESSLDIEQSYYLNSSQDWVAEGYRGDRLFTNYNGVGDVNRWTPMSALAKNGPTDSAFIDKITAAHRFNNEQYAITASFSTINNRFTVQSAMRDFTAVTQTELASRPTYTQLGITGNLSSGTGDYSISMPAVSDWTVYDNVYAVYRDNTAPYEDRILCQIDPGMIRTAGQTHSNPARLKSPDAGQSTDITNMWIYARVPASGGNSLVNARAVVHVGTNLRSSSFKIAVMARTNHPA